MTFIEIVAIIIASLIVILVFGSNIYKLKKKKVSCTSCSCCDGSCQEKMKDYINEIKLKLDNK